MWRHLGERRLVVTAVLVGTNERMWLSTESGRLLILSAFSSSSAFRPFLASFSAFDIFSNFCQKLRLHCLAFHDSEENQWRKKQRYALNLLEGD
jgi:hypothetical protein